MVPAWGMFGRRVPAEAVPGEARAGPRDGTPARSQAEAKPTAELGNVRRAPSQERTWDHSGKPFRSPLRTPGKD